MVVPVSPVLALLPSPLTTAAVWGALPEELARRAWAAGAVAVDVPDSPPHAAQWVAAAAVGARALTGAAGQGLVLVGHSGAGPLLPQVGFALRAAGAPAAAYVFVDAGLPRAGRPASRLDLLAVEDPALAEQLRRHLAAGGRFPDWTDADLVTEVPDPADRARLVEALRGRGLGFFIEPLPVPEDWPDGPCGYLRTGPAYEVPEREARQRGWPVEVAEPLLGHFAALAHPAATAHLLVRLLDRLPLVR